MNENTSAGPAPARTMLPAASYWPAAAVPIAPKMPAPITAPMPSMMRSPAPSARFSAYGLSPSTSSSEIGLRRRSCRALDKQRRQHQRDRTQELDQHVQRRPRRVFEGIADGVPHDPGLVRRTALAAVLTRLDVLLGVVPRAAAVVEQRRHQDAADRPDHEERGHRLGPEVEQLEEQAD